MKNTSLSLALILSLIGYGAGAQHEAVRREETVSPACALAVAAALQDFRAWYSEAHAGEVTGFEMYLQQSDGIVCERVEGRRITIALRPSAGRGGGVWYSIDADSFQVVERVFGR